MSGRLKLCSGFDPSDFFQTSALNVMRADSFSKLSKRCHEIKHVLMANMCRGATPIFKLSYRHAFSLKPAETHISSGRRHDRSNRQRGRVRHLDLSPLLSSGSKSQHAILTHLNGVRQACCVFPQILHCAPLQAPFKRSPSRRVKDSRFSVRGPSWGALCAGDGLDHITTAPGRWSTNGEASRSLREEVSRGAERGQLESWPDAWRG